MNIHIYNEMEMTGVDHAVIFIYQPQSGDRVFAEHYPQGKNTPEVIQHPNGCRHTIGGAHLWWETSIPTKYWRYEAKNLATALIKEWGGIAWDDQGTIHIVTCYPQKMVEAMNMAAAVFEAPPIDSKATWAGVAQNTAYIYNGEVKWKEIPDTESIEDIEKIARNLVSKWY